MVVDGGGNRHPLTYTEKRKVSLRGNTKNDMGIYTYAEVGNCVFVVVQP